MVTQGPPKTAGHALAPRSSWENVLAIVRRGIWQPIDRTGPPRRRRGADVPRPSRQSGRGDATGDTATTALDYEWQLTHPCCRLREPPAHTNHQRGSRPVPVHEGQTEAVVRHFDHKTITSSADLEVAVEYGHIERNPARGKRRRLKAAKATGAT
jgi:hypothetical protein